MLKETLRDLVGAGRATRTPLVPFGREHEVVDDELATPLEQIDEARLAIRTVEKVLLVDLHHRQPAALGVQRVSLLGEFLFLGQKLLASSKPFFSGYYLRKIHHSLSFR
jgi:hypothetical protein